MKHLLLYQRVFLFACLEQATADISESLTGLFESVKIYYASYLNLIY